MAEEKNFYYLSESDDGLDSVTEEVDNLVSEESYRDAFWMTPNIVNDMDISKEAFRVYSHLKSICGDKKGNSVWQSTKTISIYCDMGTGTVSRAKEELRNYIIPLIRVETKRKKGGGIYHEIKILDIWKINEQYSKNKKIIKFDKIEKYEELKKEKIEEKLRVSRVERGLGERSSRVETNNTTINNTTYLPAIAGKNGEEQLCQKCNQIEKEIEIGEEFGFKYDLKNKRELLADLQSSHRMETPLQNKTQSKEERVAELFFSGDADEFSERLSDYPENCRKFLHLFLIKWAFPVVAIPKKPRGSKGGLYATWINGINELVAIAGEKNFQAVLDKVYDRWYHRADEFRTQVDMPSKLKSLFILIVSEMNQDEKRNETKKEVRIETGEYVEDAGELENLLKNLR